MRKRDRITYSEWMAEYERIEGDPDEMLYKKAVAFVIDNQNSSISKLAGGIGIGFHAAQKLIGQMETDGIVGKYRAGKSRSVLLRKKKVK